MSTLYLEHFDLAEAPFSITPNPHFFFAGSNRGSLLDALKFSVQSDEGIVTVIGEVGSGKTMLCRMLLDDLPPQVDAVYLANPSFSANEILDAIAHDLGVPPPAGGAMTRIDALNRELIARYAAGRRVVLLIDEAHAMPPESLEEVRLLSNLETSRHKLVGIVLFGQPELAGVLARPNMRQLRERVVQRFGLGPLHPGELRDYLEFRLRAAGHRGNFLFSPAAVARIGRVSRGLTRRINILSDKALLSAFARNARAVAVEDVRRAERDVGFTDGGLAAPSRRRLALAAGIAAVGIGAAFAAGLWMGRSGAPAEHAADAVTRSTGMPIAAPAAVEAAQLDEARGRGDAAAPAPSRPPAGPPQATLRGAEQALSRWRAAPARGYTLQVATFRDDGHAASDDAIARIARSVPLPVAALREGDGPTPRVLVFVGQFPSAALARRAIDQLPAPLRANRPVPRPLDGLPTADRT